MSEHKRDNKRDAGPATDSEETEGTTLEPTYPELDVQVYIRPGASTVTKERQTQVRNRFESLVDIGVLAEITVEHWSKEVDVPDEGTATDEEAVELFDEFNEAIEDADVPGRLEPFFEERPQVSSFFSSSTTQRTIVFPVLGVTVRRDGELAGLYPCWLDGFHYSVGDCLDTLEAGDPPTNLE